MSNSTYDAGDTLARRAAALSGPNADAPALFAFTDPVRTPDPAALARGLPPGCGLILRTFGRPELRAAAYELADIARDRALMLLISADPQLALRCGAQGVHWPETFLGRAARWRGAFSLVTASAHGPSALRRAQTVADCIFVSPIFPSNSPSAGRALGPFRAAAYARRSIKPVYALGGVNARTIGRLKGLGLSGVGAVAGAARAQS